MLEDQFSMTRPADQRPPIHSCRDTARQYITTSCLVSMEQTCWGQRAVPTEVAALLRKLQAHNPTGLVDLHS